MLNVIAILISSTGFAVAVESGGAFVEHSFPNTTEGIQRFVSFADPLVEKEGKPYKFCVVLRADDSGEIMDWLLQNDLKPAWLSSSAHDAYLQKQGASAESATAAARACLSTFRLIFKRRTTP